MTPPIPHVFFTPNSLAGRGQPRENAKAPHRQRERMPIMFSPSRRLFLGSAVAGLAPGLSFGAAPPAPRPPPPARPPRAGTHFPPFQPSTLFLTWHRDPTTTMTVQWVGVRGETSNTRVFYAPAWAEECLSQSSTPRPYPKTDFKVFRAE